MILDFTQLDFNFIYISLRYDMHYDPKVEEQNFFYSFYIGLHLAICSRLHKLITNVLCIVLIEMKLIRF